ncbi:MAG: hypothetical protein ACLUGQ_06435 [Coprococcus sp.]
MLITKNCVTTIIMYVIEENNRSIEKSNRRKLTGWRKSSVVDQAMTRIIGQFIEPNENRLQIEETDETIAIPSKQYQ